MGQQNGAIGLDPEAFWTGSSASAHMLLVAGEETELTIDVLWVAEGAQACRFKMSRKSYTELRHEREMDAICRKPHYAGTPGLASLDRVLCGVLPGFELPSCRWAPYRRT